MSELIKQAEALGIKVDKRWKEDRLREEIAKVQPAETATEVVEEEEAVTVQEEVAEEAATEPAAEEAAASDSEAKPNEDGGAEEPFSGVTIKNMTANRNKRLGLDPRGTLTLTSEQLSDRQFMARIDHGVKTGVLGIV